MNILLFTYLNADDAGCSVVYLVPADTMCKNIGYPRFQEEIEVIHFI